MCPAGRPGHDKAMLTAARPRRLAPHLSGPAPSAATVWVALIAAAAFGLEMAGQRPLRLFSR